MRSRFVTAVTLAGLTAAVVLTAVNGRAGASTTICPADTCQGTTFITDHANSMGSVLSVEDNELKPAGQNALMFFINGYRAVSVNPVCAAAAHPYLANQACLGGFGSDGLSGGHPYLSLLGTNGWQTLTPAGIQFVNRMLAAHLTVAKLLRMYRLVTALAQKLGVR